VEGSYIGRIPGPMAGDRAIRGSGFASGPACGVAAPHPSYPLRGGETKPKGCAFWFYGVSRRNAKLHTGDGIPGLPHGARLPKGAKRQGGRTKRLRLLVLRSFATERETPHGGQNPRGFCGAKTPGPKMAGRPFWGSARDRSGILLPGGPGKRIEADSPVPAGGGDAPKKKTPRGFSLNWGLGI
jgi:hypothetical protein